jgi:hypothetical protein
LRLRDPDGLVALGELRAGADGETVLAPIVGLRG